MQCWWCYWGWPKAIRDIYERAEADIDELLPVDWEGEPFSGESALEFGPAHCVWSDENFDGVGWEIRECESPLYAEWFPGVIAIVRRSLEELQALPKELKNEPPDYDGQHPENFPPPGLMEIGEKP